MLLSLVTILLLGSNCFASPTASPVTTYSAPVATAPVVTVKNGSYSGVYSSIYYQDFFLGMAFAQPPVNDLRYRVPRSLNSTWDGTKLATAYPHFCYGYLSNNEGLGFSEDCLYLNVVRPSRTEANAKLPVVVSIHGGGLFEGGSGDPLGNLTFLVRNSVEMGHPIVAVSIQYRLSGFGFLGGKEALEGGATNLGLRDQRLALHWIYENIAAFGGDPNKVTIWGESGGAQSVGFQLLAYNGRDDGLFRAAIAESGGPANIFFPLNGGYNSTSPQAAYNALVSNTSCASTLSTGNSLSCLRTIPVSEINNALNRSTYDIAPFPAFPPVLDGDFIATYPSLQVSSGNFVRVPLLIGCNSDEGTIFAADFGGKLTINSDADFVNALNTLNLIPPNSITSTVISYLYPNIQALGSPSLENFPQLITEGSALANTYGLQFRRLAAYIGDTWMIAPRRATNIAWSTFNVPSYAFRFDAPIYGTSSILGATHGQELEFVFNNTMYLGNNSSSYGKLAIQMSRSWLGFITQLDPNAHGLSGINHWPVYNTTSGVGMDFVLTASKSSHAEPDTFRGEAIAFISENALSVYGR